MRALLAGWFSFPDGSATAGDLCAAGVARQWLERAGIPADLAVAPPFQGDVRYDSVDPADYTHAVFVCGPFGGKQVEDFLRRFASCRLIGLNLTLGQPVETWQPFDLLVARDSRTQCNADMVFAAPFAPVPVVGMVFVEPYPGADTVRPALALRRIVASRAAVSLEIDTRLDRNSTGLRTAAEVESAIARMDVVLTTRLHGLVLALKHGVPVIAIDPDPRIHKLARQAGVIDWPHVYGSIPDDATLATAFEYCLTPEARSRAALAGARGRRLVDTLGDDVLARLADAGGLDASRAARHADPSPRRSANAPDAGRLAAWPAVVRLPARALLALLRRIPAMRP
jgi:Polysaccharide pyruvyl transferase